MTNQPDVNTPEGSLEMALRESATVYTAETKAEGIQHAQLATMWATVCIAQQLARLNDILWYGHKSADDILNESLR